MKILSVRRQCGAIVKKLVHPGKAFTLFKLIRKKTDSPRSSRDLQLELYSKILPSGFLNYGYFAEPDVSPESLSLDDIRAAQVKYGELIVSHITDSESPVLDAGCGMGGLIGLLLKNNMTPIGLTPDEYQIKHLEKKFPRITLLQTKFENIPGEHYAHFFGTVVMAESLQYMSLEKTAPVVAAILKNKGTWIVTDYFQISPAKHDSGHPWEDFAGAIKQHGFKVIFQKDITCHVLPTLAYLNMWGANLGRPLLDFVQNRFKRKHPALSYLLAETIEDVTTSIHDHLDIINPDIFKKEKSYRLLVLQKKQ